jgi:hypothetical protein
LFNLHIKKEVGTIRGYSGSDSYEKRSVPLFSCIIHYIGDTEVYLCDARGVMPSGSYSFLMTELKKLGKTTVRYERRGKIKTVHL